MKCIFTETIKQIKKDIKKTSDIFFIQFHETSVYMSNGNYIIKLPINTYTRNIQHKISALPAYKGINETILIKRGDYSSTDSELLTKNYKEIMSKPSGITKSSPMIFDVSNRKCRAFFWIENDKAAGTLINDIYFEMSKEFCNTSLSGSYYYDYTKEKISTIIAGNDDYRLIILPVTRVDDFNDLLDTLTYEAMRKKEAKTRKKTA